MTPSTAVLITGCSSGIGHATAKHLYARGWTVYATARRREALADLHEAGCHTLALDVTDEQSMRRAVNEVEEREGAVGVLVNNAGYSQSGAIETVAMDAVRTQFETNVFGLARMCQLVLPKMRAQRAGKIVNLSSMGGRLTFPGAGFYHATKYAVEAISDALRFEVQGFGIQVIVVEPGLIRTRFAESAVGSMIPAAGGEADGSGPYGDFNAAVMTASVQAYEVGPMARLGGPPQAVARKIEKAISAGRPRTRYTVTPSARVLLGLRAVLRDRAWDAFVSSQFPRPGEPRKDRER
ncbi:MAG TPA: oxidoreductase [Solirubrobacteraceae bacterium]|nr:oxidoreductase [Solirubrobacteraceae bacterium]